MGLREIPNGSGKLILIDLVHVNYSIDLPIQPDPDFSVRVMNRIEKSGSTNAFSYGWLASGFALCLLAEIQVMAPFGWAVTDLLSVIASLKQYTKEFVFGRSSLLLPKTNSST